MGNPYGGSNRDQSRGSSKMKIEAKTTSLSVQMDGTDGVRAWCVAFAIFIIYFVVSSVERSSSILYIELIKTYDLNREQASLPFAIKNSFRFLAGPIVGVLGALWGVRVVSIAGAAIATISSAACYLARGFISFTVLWGIVNGFASSCLVSLPQVILSQYFLKHATTASGFSYAGSSIGSIVFPFIIGNFLMNYGLQGTFLMISGYMAHTIAASMLLRSPVGSKTKSPSKPKMIERNIHHDTANRHKKKHKTTTLRKRISVPDLVLTSGGKSPKTYGNPIGDNNDSSKKEVETCWLCKDPEMVLQIVLSAMHAVESRLKSDSLCLNQDQFNYDRMTIPDLLEAVKTISNTKQEWAKSKGGSESRSREPNERFVNCRCRFADLMKQSNYEENARPHKYLQAENTVPGNTAETMLSEISELYKLSNESRGLFESVYVECPRKNTKIPPQNNCIKEPANTGLLHHITATAKLHLKPIMWFFSACRCISIMSYVTLNMVVVDYAMDAGLSKADGELIISISSACDVIARLSLGWITDKGYLSLQTYTMVLMELLGLCNVVLPFTKLKPAMIFLFSVISTLWGSYFVSLSVLTPTYFHGSELIIAMGCSNFFGGLISMLLPSIIGHFRDGMGSYDGLFYINGSIFIALGFGWLFEPQIVNYSRSQREENIESVSTTQL